MREYSMCVFAGGMWRGLAEGGGRHGLSESAITPPSLASRSAASHLSPAPWPAACRQALANLPPPPPLLSPSVSPQKPLANRTTRSDC